MKHHLLLPQQPVVLPISSHPPTGGFSQCLLFFPQDSPEAGGEREEEQAFLVSLYKFMKERHTPIERVPHLGFKQSASLGCRQGGGAWQRALHRQGSGESTSTLGDPGRSQPEGVTPRKGSPLSAQGAGLQGQGHWAPSTQSPAWLAIAVALCGDVLALCLLDRAMGMGCQLSLLLQRLTVALPPSLQLTCGRSTRQWRSWGPMRW